MLKTDFKATIIDPGVTTGYVLASQSEDQLTLHCFQERDTPLELLRRLQFRPDYSKIIVCEDFEFRPGRKKYSTPVNIAMDSAHLIGIVRAYAESERSKLYMQQAMIALGRTNKYGNIKGLKSAGCYLPGADYHHSMSAMSHFLRWYWFGPGYQYNVKPFVTLVKGKP